MTSLPDPESLQRLMRAEFPASPEQWAAITAPLEPVVVVAGAGSGKTTLMAARVVYLVATGQVRPDQVLGLTFTTKAAAELRSRILTALSQAGLPADGAAPIEPDLPHEAGADVVEPTVSTYHAYAGALLTDHGLRIGHEPDTRVIADASRYQLGGRVIANYPGHVEFLSDHPPTVIGYLLALDAAMSEHLVSPDRVAEYDAWARARLVEQTLVKPTGPLKAAINTIDRRTELLELVRAYRRLKADLGLMDFGDQIELAARLAQECPEVGVAERDRFRVVLLDEYQDTSTAQAIMLSRLFSGDVVGEMDPRSGPDGHGDGPPLRGGLGHPVMAVGDPNQAIYGWRGASVQNILHFAESFPSADPAREAGLAETTEGRGRGRVLPLTVNRRSKRRILEVANTLAEPLYQTYSGSVARLESPEGAAEGQVEAHVFERHVDELAWLADAVIQAHDAGEVAWSQIAVLTRTNSDSAEVYDVLSRADIPVEIVGLSGLIRLPEVAEVVATLSLLADVTDNAALLTLLSGPRWAVGPRDLQLLAQRARDIAGQGTAPSGLGLPDQLTAIADGVDPAEIPALLDALESPGEGDYSRAARDRFALLAAELRLLRTHVGEPLLDIVRRIIDLSGVDLELASAISQSADARRENLDLFVKAVADFQAIDGAVTLPALLAYLTAEDEAGNGLDVATPTAADSVKLLTVHRSKGLEWHTVFLYGVCDTRFPSNRGRSLWVTKPDVLPAPLRGDAPYLPQLDNSFASAKIGHYKTACKAADLEEELRLGYVAFTRAAERLVVTSHVWDTIKTPRGPSPYQQVVAEAMTSWGTPPERWMDKPEKGITNPYLGADLSLPWPRRGIGPEIERRREAAELVRAADPASPDEELDLVDAARAAEWDEEIERLLAEARATSASTLEVPMPASLSATALSRLATDPGALAAELARPMPRPPSPAAAFGSRFHSWVEVRFGQQRILDLDDLPGRADAEVDDHQLTELIVAFEAGSFADRVPEAVEAPFSLVLSGQVLRGRIDAVYREPDGSYFVVDWKTGHHQNADPLQLAVYRLAWAELTGVPVGEVAAAFHYVRSGETVRPERLPARGELEQLVASVAALSLRDERGH